MMKCYWMLVLYCLADLCNAQEMRMGTGKSSRQDLSNFSAQSIERIAKNKVILEKEQELLDKSSMPLWLLDQERSGGLTPRVIVPSEIQNWRSRFQEIQKVVPAADLLNITLKNSQDAVGKEFCTERINSSCINGIKSFGASIGAKVSAKSSTCKALQLNVAAIPYFDGGDPDSVPIDQLKTVLAYYEACTTAELPDDIQKLIGIIIDLDRPVQSTGIEVNGKYYLPIGMAVQLSPTRIYSARHVIFRTTENRKFTDPRNIAQLRYVPLASPTILLPVVAESTPGLRATDLADTPMDQVVLRLTTSYLAPGVVWPVVQRLPIILGAQPTMLYVAGLQMTLARASIAGVSKDFVHIPSGKWTQFIRRDNTPTCSRITQTEKGCMLHGCDTIGGLSGTPIFARRDGIANAPPLVIGVHSGGAFSNNNICSASPLGIPFNLAALPDFALLNN